MAWDTEGTKRKIKDAATAEFTLRGPAGTTVERIAKRAGVNKERVYNYFGSKDRLFSAVLRDELTRAAEAVPPAFDDGEDAGDYAGRLSTTTGNAPSSSGCCAGRPSPSTTRCPRRSCGASTTSARSPGCAVARTPAS